MRFDLTRPCSNCPFLREGGIRVHPERAREIAQGQLNGREERTFPCHKTTIDVTITNEDGDEEYDKGWGPHTQYCGGAMTFAILLGSYNQTLQIAERLGWWDPSQMEPTAGAGVFRSVLEMMAGQTERPRPRSKRPLKHTIAKRRSF